MAVTISYKAKELKFMRRVFRQNTRKKVTQREKTCIGELEDIMSGTLKTMKSRCRRNWFTNGGQTTNLSD